MSFFMRKKSLQNPKNDQIGLSEDEHRYCLVHFLTGEPTALYQEKQPDAALSLTEFCQQAVGNLASFTIVRPIPHDYIWRKYIFLPKQADSSLIHRQIIQVIKQELPIPLTDIYFDYSLFPEADGKSVRVIIYALRKSFAEPLMLSPNTILDCALHCAQRGLHFLQPEAEASHYHFQGYRFQFQRNGLELNRTEERSDCLSSEADPLYVLALGAARWRKEGRTNA